MSHYPGHRELVAFRGSEDNAEPEWLSYSCSEPGCDWNHTWHSPNATCKEFANSAEVPLDKEIEEIEDRRAGGRQRRHGANGKRLLDADQESLFPDESGR